MAEAEALLDVERRPAAAEGADEAARGRRALAGRGRARKGTGSLKTLPSLPTSPVVVARQIVQVPFAISTLLYPRSRGVSNAVFQLRVLRLIPKKMRSLVYERDALGKQAQTQPKSPSDIEAAAAAAFARIFKNKYDGSHGVAPGEPPA